ncbi:MAG: hypothetical protein IJ097_01300 [Bacilli bacterium]|nr:hypothetical protein [Bacilli bacterium]
MNQQKKLIIERGIFTFILFIILGVIVVTEKMGGVLIPKVTKKMNTYIKDNYKQEKTNFIYDEVTYKNTTYKMKVKSKYNKYHYFYIYYYSKKITDTYKEDYLEGKNLLNHIKKTIKKDIKNKTNINCEVEMTSKLNDYTDIVKQRIIKEDNILELKVFKVKKEFIINEWNEESITNTINKYLNKFKDNNITPKSHTIIITNKEDITESIEIKNINEKFIDNSANKEIINDIINNKKSDLLKENKITYKYLN